MRRREENEMREELDALAAIAGRREIGSMAHVMEDARAVWGWTWLASIGADLRYALRTLRSQPAFVAVAALSLGLAIGANSAVFSFADALIFRPLPVPHPSAILDIALTTPDDFGEGMSFPDYRDLRQQSRSFAALAAYRIATVAAATDAAAPARVRFAALVTDNFFPTLEVPAAAGRTFLPSEAGVPVAVVSDDFLDQFGGKPAVGSIVHVNGIAFTVVGVAPKWFTGTERILRPSLYLPLAMSQRLDAAAKDPLEDRGLHDLVVKGRLAAGATMQSAQAELSAVAAGLAREFPKTDGNRRVFVRTELQRSILLAPQLLSLIKMLMGLVALILIIACSNLANLLLARARARSREIAIRLSIGAGRMRLVRQLMTESFLLAILGGLAGVVFAYGGVRLLETLSVPSEPPNILPVEMDWRVVEFSLLAALVSCLLFGLAPAWQTVRMDVLAALKSGGRGASGSRRTLGRDTLVVAQIALAMVVLIAAGMFFAGFRKALVVAPDFRTDHVIGMDTAPALLHYSPAQTVDYYRQLVDRARLMPGAADVAMTESLPLSTSQTVVGVVPEGYRLPKGREKIIVFGAAVDSGYFRLLRVEITRGRAFNDADRADSARVAIVNQQFAKAYWPNQDPIGKRIRIDKPDGPEAEVVGVAKTGHYLLVNEQPSPFVYLPYTQNPRRRMTLIVQSTGDPAALAAPLRDLVRSIDPNMPLYNLRPVATLYQSRATDTWLQFFQMVGTMALIGLTLATIGLYGLIAYTVNRRVQEFGIRVALGARKGDVVWLVERRGLVLAALGLAVGGVLTRFALPMLSAGFFGLGSTSAAVYFFVPLALLLVSALASYLPARRAASLDPLRALRNE
ncbi:MAG TPA: ABC transporter permease [Bryobacteraceae bacterium]|jgi:predicted permease|nr:ABC transporter permease [Bryobacteraceae bacterium]